jgi:hypothetical protein
LLKRALDIEISKETVREITESIGKSVFDADVEKADHLINHMDEIDMKPESEKKPGVLYVMTDGAAVNTRVEDENGSTWRENKTVIVFTDKDMIRRKDGGISLYVRNTRRSSGARRILEAMFSTPPSIGAMGASKKWSFSGTERRGSAIWPRKSSRKLHKYWTYST